jgi:hypothetical protein
MTFPGEHSCHQKKAKLQRISMACIKFGNGKNLFVGVVNVKQGSV